MQGSDEQQSTTFNFPAPERKVFKKNFLGTVVIELRYPTCLRLKDKEPTDISEAIRRRFPIYSPEKEMQMTPLGTTDPQPVYKFFTRTKDPALSISTSNLVLATKKYKSFEDFSSHIAFLIERAIPCLDTTFFTRVGLRYVNNISGMQKDGGDIFEWINHDLVKPVGVKEIGTIDNMRNELTGQLPRKMGYYFFRYGLSPLSLEKRKFVLDWDYYREDVEVTDCMKLLKTFNTSHFPFFWWALGVKAREALINGNAST